eukprot:1145650-Pelagomonas_calceolata.AAC.1
MTPGNSSGLRSLKSNPQLHLESKPLAIIRFGAMHDLAAATVASKLVIARPDMDKLRWEHA